jgi:hypothetical protein
MNGRRGWQQVPDVRRHGEHIHMSVAPAMQRAGVAVYEEQVISDLLDDISFRR